MFAFIWLYAATLGAVAYGIGGFVREIVRVAPGNPSMHYVWWILGSVTAFALVRVLDLINRNVVAVSEISKMKR